jgi:hypothetical protein
MINWGMRSAHGNGGLGVMGIAPCRALDIKGFFYRFHRPVASIFSAARMVSE